VLQTFSFLEWRVDADPNATEAAYRARDCGSADGCPCSDCKHWIRIREKAVPQLLQDFLRNLGIDPAKEFDLAEYERGSVVRGRCLFVGKYYCVGTLRAGPDSTRNATPKGFSTQTQQVEPGLKIGLSSSIPAPFVPPPFRPQETVVITFEVHTSCPEGDA
jgi:hypothetical protein